MKVDYSEKTYEEYFLVELHAEYIRNRNFFAPSQADEAYLGADLIAYLGRRFDSIRLNKRFYNRNYLARHNHFLKNVAKRIPAKLKFNVFIQFKRPEHIVKSNGGQWNSFNKPYYRFSIYKEQQARLDHISRLLKDLSIIYASPEAADTDQLYQLHLDGKLIDSSCYVESKTIKNHSAVAYLSQKIFLCSDPERVEKFHIQEYFKEENYDESDNVYSRVLELANQIKENQKEFEEIFKSWNFNRYQDIQEYGAVEAFAIVRDFLILANLNLIC